MDKKTETTSSGKRKQKPRTKPGARTDVPVLAQFCSFSDYQQANSHVFPTEASLRWFYRVNLDRLRATGAVVEIARRLFVNAPIFEQELFAISSNTPAADGPKEPTP